MRCGTSSTTGGYSGSPSATAPLVDFEDEDEDAGFLNGVGAHLSQRGWRSYDEVLDRFYHAALD